MVAASTPTSWVLQMVRGDEPGREISLESGRLTIGRRSSNDLVLSEVQVSGVHAEIAVEAGRLVLRDLGSTNGTFLDGNRIDEVVLDHGETIRIGRTEMRVVDSSRKEAAGLHAASGTPGGRPARGAGHERDRRDGGEQEMDGCVERAGPRRHLAPGAILGLLVVVVAGSLYFYFRPPGSAREMGPAARPENVTGSIWSFEDAAEIADRMVLQADGLVPWQVVSGRSRTGAHCLAVGPGAGEGALAVLQGLGVRPERRYAIRAQVRRASQTTANRGDGVGEVFLGVKWVAPDAEHHERRVAERRPGETFESIEGRIDLPAGLDSIDLVLGATGPGSFELDDVEVVDEGRAQETVPESLDSRYGFTVDGMGIRLERGGHVVLVAGRPVVRLGAQSTRVSPLLARVRVAASNEEGHLRADVSAECPLRDSLISMAFDWQPDERDRRLRTLSERGVEEFSSSFSAESVESVLLGSDKGLIELRFETPQAIRVQDEEARSRILVGGSLLQAGDRNDGTPNNTGDQDQRESRASSHWDLRFQLRLDFRTQAIEASRLVFDARQHLEHGRDGEAYLLVERLLNRLPYDDDEVNSAREIAQRIMTEGRKTQRELEALMAVAAFLDSPVKLSQVEERAATALGRFGKTPLEDSLYALSETAHAEVERHRAARLEAEAQRLFQVAEVLEGRDDRKGTAELILRYINDHYPGTPWAERAGAVRGGGP